MIEGQDKDSSGYVPLRGVESSLRVLMSAIGVGQRSNHRLHNRRTNGVSEQLDSFTPRAVFQNVSLGKTHCLLQLRDLEHAHLMPIRRRLHVGKSIERRESPKRRS